MVITITEDIASMAEWTGTESDGVNFAATCASYADQTAGYLAALYPGATVDIRFTNGGGRIRVSDDAAYATLAEDIEWNIQGWLHNDNPDRFIVWAA